MQMKLHEKLYILRKKNGYTQTELAEVLGVTRQSISNWELGTIQPSTSRIKKLSELYSVSFETFFDEDIEIQLRQKNTEGQEQGQPERQGISPVLSKQEREKCPYCKGNLEKGFLYTRRGRSIFWLPIGESVSLLSQSNIEKRGGHVLGSVSKVGFFSTNAISCYYCNNCHCIIAFQK